MLVVERIVCVDREDGLESGGESVDDLGFVDADIAVAGDDPSTCLMSSSGFSKSACHLVPSGDTCRGIAATDDGAEVEVPVPASSGLGLVGVGHKTTSGD
jgi:hypothetical protein